MLVKAGLATKKYNALNVHPTVIIKLTDVLALMRMTAFTNVTTAILKVLLKIVTFWQAHLSISAVHSEVFPST